jgi:CARDB protein
VLYERARLNIDAALDAQGVTTEKIPESQFLPDPVTEWLDPDSVQSKLADVAGASGAVAPGLHGTGLVQTAINGVVLTPGVPGTVSGGPPWEVEADVQNQGDNPESDVTVSYTLSGGQQDIRGDATIPKIAPGETKTANMAIKPDPPSGVALTLKVNVEPVPGEQVTDNNKATYTVTFP